MTGDELRFEMTTLFLQHRDVALKTLLAATLRRLADDLEPDAVADVIADHFDPKVDTAFKIVPEVVDGHPQFNLVGRR
jgi:hypothetical protein